MKAGEYDDTILAVQTKALETMKIWLADFKPSDHPGRGVGRNMRGGSKAGTSSMALDMGEFAQEVLV